MKSPSHVLTQWRRPWPPEILARRIRQSAWGLLAGTLFGFASPTLLAQPSTDPASAAPPSSAPSASTPSQTNAPVVPAMLTRRTSTRAVDLATTPSAAVVVTRSPLLEAPASAAMTQMSLRPSSPVLESRMNRETLEERLRRAGERYTPEQAGTAFRYLRRKTTLRGFWDLVDPLAPLPPSDLPAAAALDPQRDRSAPPRAMRSDATHEATLRVF